MHDLDHRLPSFEAALAQLPPAPVHGAESDEPFWDAVSDLYKTSTALTNLENGYWGVMAEPVKEMLGYWIDRVNFENTLWLRERWPEVLERLRHTVAKALGCEPGEIVLTRGATEAMLALIGGYNRLQPGDTVLYSDLDYPAMRSAMEWLRQRRGVVPVSLAMPEPATRQSVLDAYAEALRQHPNTRLVLLTHLTHGTGLVLPVRELAALAQSAGAEVIVDAAHSWGQLDFDASSLGVPYAAFNLHKWIGAPLGCGCLYIRRDSLAAIDPYFGDRDFPDTDIRSRIHTGSPSFAAWLTIPAALQLHRRISARAKEARLRALRNHWVEQVRDWPGLEILTPNDPRMVGGITSFRLRGRGSPAEADAVVAALRDRHGVLTVRRAGPVRGDVVRVTPAIYTRREDLDRLVEGLRELCR
ncbi:aminotransferase class V-fold PLP-dependent enzyme [Caldimonas brevitalea]|uniref:Penicillin epimerase n=1 Tax=Caldimonas brevitalea TaxID=413882 RepID=A0A0G3BJL4_9BURK|nr:aminotransferase class V-fold PLP-dependent enzyme [Caldimonas brevitalea]AKJ27571.1 penicillin epimerase [Caldimonas brevitalea]